MSCETTRRQLEAFLSGKLAGEESRGVRRHLASCNSCAGSLSPLDRVEVLAAADPEIEPSADLAARFRTRLEAHRARSGRSVDVRSLWSRLLEWTLPRQLAAAGALAGFLALGLYVGIHRPDQPAAGPAAGDISIAENLPLLRDLKVIENLDLLEDFDAIESLSRGGVTPSTVQ